MSTPYDELHPFSDKGMIVKCNQDGIQVFWPLEILLFEEFIASIIVLITNCIKNKKYTNIN